jgi:hypothetical protein
VPFYDDPYDLFPLLEKLRCEWSWLGRAVQSAAGLYVSWVSERVTLAAWVWAIHIPEVIHTSNTPTQRLGRGGKVEEGMVGRHYCWATW